MTTAKAIPFSDMAHSLFSFGAFTRIRMAMIDAVPRELRSDLVKVRRFILDNEAGEDVHFTGEITIYRGHPKVDEKSGNAYIPMSVVAMDEVGYDKSLDTTIRMTADFTKANFGMTHQFSSNREAPAEARMLMTLKFSGLHGRMADQLTATQPTVAKEIQATINSFPIANGQAIFRHVGDKAREIAASDGTVLGYLADGTMIPQQPLATPKVLVDGLNGAKLDLGIERQISKPQHAFLMRQADHVA
jgi:hypothetical protein